MKSKLNTRLITGFTLGGSSTLQTTTRIMFRLLAWNLVLVILSGCSPTPKTRVIEDASNSERIPFIREGVTTREEIMTRLGAPVSFYENQRIVIYWMHENKTGKFQVVPQRAMPIDPEGGITWKLGLHNLVLVFDDHNILERHSLVFIR